MVTPALDGHGFIAIVDRAPGEREIVGIFVSREDVESYFPEAGWQESPKAFGSEDGAAVWADTFTDESGRAVPVMLVRLPLGIVDTLRLPPP